MEWNGYERRASPLSEEQIEAIAERAAEKAFEQIYAQIGKSVVSKALWVVGAVCLSGAAWLAGSGHIK